MGHSKKRFIARGLIGLVGLWAIGAPVSGRDVTLVLSPQKAPAEVGQSSLLPPESSLTDGDAVPFYEKAAKALPDKTGDQQIQGWLRMPIDQLPIEQAEQALGAYGESLKLVAEAVKCRRCNWPQWKPGMDVAYHEEYRRLIFAVRLRARLKIAQDRYDDAILALQTGFGMARQHGQAPTILQAQTGIAMTAVMCREVEELVQREDSPNLYPALAGLPKPFVDIEKAIDYEKKAASSGLRGRLLSKQTETVLKPAHDQSRLLAKRLDRDLAALQCVEAIRSYAASHGGTLPEALADITEVSVPKDPMNGEPFSYVRTGSTATLESSLPPGRTEKDRTRYEITIRN